LNRASCYNENAMKRPATSSQNRRTRKVPEYVKKKDLNRESIWKEEGPLISQLDIELTECCDNDCIHCCINLTEDDVGARSREMGTDFVKDICTGRYSRTTISDPALSYQLRLSATF